MFGKAFSKSFVWSQPKIGLGGRFALGLVFIPLLLALLPLVIFIALSQRRHLRSEKTRARVSADGAYIVDLEPEDYNQTKNTLPPKQD